MEATSNPCKIRTGILAGSRRDRGGNPIGIPARFWPPGFSSPAGISRSRQDSRRETKFPAAKISPGSKNPGGQNLTGILPRISPRFSPRRKNPGGQISARSCGESYQDSRREAIIPAAKISPGCYCESHQDSRRGANSQWQKFWRDLAGISPRLATGSKILGEIHCGNLGKILDMLPRISFSLSPMFTCLKMQTKVS